jgi:hypothetical protein
MSRAELQEEYREAAGEVVGKVEVRAFKEVIVVLHGAGIAARGPPLLLNLALPPGVQVLPDRGAAPG